MTTACHDVALERDDCQETGRSGEESDGRSRHLEAEERNIDERDTQTDTQTDAEDEDWSRKFAYSNRFQPLYSLYMH